jgi:putative peptide maturation system protein
VTSTVPDIVREVAALLLQASVDGVGEEELRGGLAGIAVDSFRTDLVPHREIFDGSCSFDVIVRGAGPTVAVGVSGAGVPWPLRGVRAGSEHTLVRVDGCYLSVTDALEHLDWLFADADVMTELLRITQLLDYDLSEVEVSPAEVEETMNAFRRRHGLLSAEQTERWLNERRMRASQLAEIAHRIAAYAVLRRELVGDRIDAAVSARRHRWDRVLIVWADEEVTLPDAWGTMLRRRTAGGRAGVLDCTVGELSAEFAALSHAKVGIPVRLDGCAELGYAVVLDRRPAAEDSVRVEVERELFAEHLDEQRREADVEWYYGDSAASPR